MKITPAGYRLLHRPRADRVGGGTALLFKDNFNYVNSPLVNKKSSFEFSEDLIEALSVQLSHQSSYTGYHILRFTLSPQASSFWNSVTR